MFGYAIDTRTPSTVCRASEAFELEYEPKLHFMTDRPLRHLRCDPVVKSPQAQFNAAFSYIPRPHLQELYEGRHAKPTGAEPLYDNVALGAFTRRVSKDSDPAAKRSYCAARLGERPAQRVHIGAECRSMHSARNLHYSKLPNSDFSVLVRVRERLGLDSDVVRGNGICRPFWNIAGL